MNTTTDTISKKSNFNKKILTTESLMLIPMFTAMTGILAQIFIPLPFTPVPINLAMVAVFLGAGLLGGARAAISQIMYVLLGAIGVPVFAGFTSGLGIVVGATGGYLIGYIVAAFVIGVLIKRLPKTFLYGVTAMSIGMICCYILGTLWFLFVTNTGGQRNPEFYQGFWFLSVIKTQGIAALTMCVFPFIPGDILKIITSCILIKRFKKAIKY